MKVIGNYVLSKDSLGKGQFGAVYKCHQKGEPSNIFACKMIVRKSLSTRLFNNLKNEINILSKINSPYVIGLKDLQKTENNFYLIMECANGGDLENLKDIRGRFKEAEARLILQQLVAGFKEIYKMQVMHRDLKLANILVHFPNEDFSASEIPEGVQRTIHLNQRFKNIDLLKSDI